MVWVLLSNSIKVKKFTITTFKPDPNSKPNPKWIPAMNLALSLSLNFAGI